MIEQKAGYSVWNGMMGRCYRPTTKAAQRNYEDVTVCKEWHTFENFQKWFIEHHKEGYELDKDLFIPHNKEYSPDKCFFVPNTLNVLIQPMAKGYSKKRNKYVARVKRGNKNYNLGTFDTAEEAREEYLKNKDIVIKLELPQYKGKVPDLLYHTLHARYVLYELT